MRLLFFCLTILTSFVGFSQSSFPNEEIQYSPGGKFEKVFDHFGNEFLLKDIKINTDPTVTNKVVTFNDCSSGYFKLYYEDGSGFELNSGPDAALHAQRRAVLCQLFNDLSQFIVPVDPNIPVNIWIKSIYNIFPSGTTLPLGAASGLYTIPSNTNSTVGGIIDNQIWKTINSGIDAYTNVGISFSNMNQSLGNSSPTYYHGVLTFNFNNINWNTDLSVSSNSQQYDLYSVALHEITHALGFASLIKIDGTSKLGSPYYTRYDSHLKAFGTDPLIISNSTCSQSYNYGFNPTLNSTVLAPSTIDCNVNNNIYFVSQSINQPVYVSSSFSEGSSLSHFEDLCHLSNVDNSNGIYPDNQYYVMCETGGLGALFTKRYLKVEEKNTLCEIGYNLNNSFGDVTNSNLNYFQYPISNCVSSSVVGVNDGIGTNSEYTFVINLNESFTFSYNDFLNNDYPSQGTNLTYECAESVYGLGTVNQLDATTFEYIANSSISGVDLIRYIPIGSNGNKGNITYIYVYISNGTCVPNACVNYVSNGDFENTTGCGYFQNDQNIGVPTAQVDCWNSVTQTADIYSRNCTIPHLTIPSASAAWNENNQIVPNNHFVNLAGVVLPVPGPPIHFIYNIETIQNKLSHPLIPTEDYLLSFRIKTTSSGFSTNSIPLIFAGSTSLFTSSNQNISTTPTNLTILHQQLITLNYEWVYYEIPLPAGTFNNTLNYLTLIPAAYLIPNISQYGHSGQELQIDDISIVKISDQITFTPPPTICMNQIINLEDYINLPGGTFNVSGVNVTTFNSSILGLGTHQITYTYTNNINCVTNVSAYVTVVENPTVTINCSQTSICEGNSSTLSVNGTGITSYIWSNNEITSNINVSPITSNSYSVTVTNSNGCQTSLTQSIIVNTYPVASITAISPTTFCEGGSVILTTPLDAAYTYQWQLDGNNISGATSNSYTAITSGSYTVVITNNNCSSTSNSISVTVNPSPTVNNITSQTVCAGQQTTPITFSGTATSYNWSNSNTTIGLGAINSVDISSFTATNSSSLPIISTITVTPLSGTCTGMPITFTITVNPRPSFSSATVVENSGLSNNDGTICLGASVTLSTTADNVTWDTSPSQQTQSITVSPTASTIYTFTTTNQYGCSFSNFVSITVNNLPVAPIITFTENSGLTPNDGIVCSGFGVTLNASGSLSPVWSTGNSGNVILVSPTSTTTYSATVTNSYGCTSTSNQVITVISPTVNSIANRNLCVNTNSTLINLNGGFPGTDYSWSNSNTAIGLGASGNGSIPSFVGLNGTPFPITGTITVIPTLDGCTGSPMSFNIIVNPLPNISISPNTVSITPGNSIQLTVTGATTYSWSPANGLSCTTCPNPVATPTTTTTYIAEGFINLTGCSSSASVQVVVEPVVSCNCTNNILSGNLSTNPTAKLSYCIDNNLNITGNNVTFTTSEFKIASNVTITVKPGAKLTILGCHLYSCGNMWNGIVVEPGGQLVVDDGLFFASSGWIIISHTFNSFIEDAKTAIQIQDNSPLTANILKVKNVVFNRNGCGIRIGTYTQNLATYPFSIENSIFTCRNIPFQTVFTPSNSSTWTQIAAIRGTSPTNNTNLGNVYISNSNYSQTDAAAYLKAPFPNQKSDVGIELVNVGLTLNASSTTPIYREFKMGSTLNMTIFDNLVYGINLINSNFTTVNSVFQNTATKSGVGIFATASDFKNYRLQVLPVLATVGNNKFVDCNKAIITNNYFENNIQYSDVRSTQSIPVTNPTKYGFYLTSNRYKNYNISYNSFYNVYTAVAIATLNNFYNVTGTLTNGQYAGKINVDFNTIRPNLSGVTVTQQYVENAITLENTGMLTESANGVISVISTNGNTIFANKGIVANNWKKQNIQIQNNNITITNNQNISSLFGIKVANCSSPNNFIRNNTVTGFYNPVANSPASSDPDLTGIVTSLSPGFSVTCNTTSNTVRGIGFNGGNPNTTFKNNTMKNHRYGFFLDNNGVIDQQGTLNLPADNQWLGTWPTGNYKTALLTGSSAQNSPMYVRNITNYNPNGSSYTSLFSNDLYSTNAFPPPPSNQLSNLRYSNSINYPTNCLGVLFFPTLISSFENVALDAIIYSNDISGLGEKMRFINKDILYKTISQDSLLKDSSQVLMDFYNSNYSTSFEKINSIQKKLSSGKFNLASIENIALIAQNNIEDNYKKYHEIYIKYYQQSALSKQDSTSLKVLSEKCPFSDGAAIYQARSLYNLIFKTFDSYLDNCQIQEPTKMMQNESDNNLDTKNLIVYPNPAKDEIFIRCNNQGTAFMDIKILDANGKLVYSNPMLIFSGNLASFTLNVDQGIYFIQLINPAANEKNIEKLIIQK